MLTVDDGAEQPGGQRVYPASSCFFVGWVRSRAASLISAGSPRRAFRPANKLSQLTSSWAWPASSPLRSPGWRTRRWRSGHLGQHRR